MKLAPTTKKYPIFPSASNRSGKTMNRPLAAIVLLVCSIGLIGCGDTVPSSQSPSAEPTLAASSPGATAQPETPPASPVAQNSPIAQSTAAPVTDLEPEVGVIRQIQQGDLLCYITFTDEAGTERTEGAIFELCEQPQQYLNQRVRLVYGVRNVSDCSSNEPCGKSRRANIIVQLNRVDDAGRNLSNDTTVLRNGEWTITIGNHNSWSGVNGTGNLSYRGCNSKQECLELAGGEVTCRNGICATIWRNGNYTYTLTSPITENPAGSPSTLIVAKNGKELQRIAGLR